MDQITSIGLCSENNSEQKLILDVSHLSPLENLNYIMFMWIINDL